MTSNRVVAVLGSPLAGVGAVAAALRAGLPDAQIVDHVVPGRAPDAVLAVVSAVAPVTRSEWARVQRAATDTGLLIGVVTKIDAHRRWRDVMAANRQRVQGWGECGAEVPWLGVAAAPDLGVAVVAELVALLRDGLADPAPVRRRHRAAVGPGAAEVRCALAQTRLQLLRKVRNRASRLLAELRAEASTLPAGGSVGFEQAVRARAERFDAELAVEIDHAVAAMATRLGLDDPTAAAPPVDHRLDPPGVVRFATSRRLESRLTAVLGIGFGLGVALASSRLVAGVAPGLAATGVAAGVVAAVALVVWVVRARRLLNDRALLDRWVTEVAAALRWQAESMIAERLLGAESAWVAARSRTAREDQAEGSACGAKRVREDVTDQYVW